MTAHSGAHAPLRVPSEGMSEKADVRGRALERIGSVLRGKYRLDGILGVGGMAVVYAATHRNRKRFALKVLHAEFSVQPDFRARFVREGYVANSVGDDGAVAVLDDDIDEAGTPFLVMDLLQGADLEQLRMQRNGTLPLEVALAAAHRVLRVLDAAHQKGIVHRDVKPANCFVVQSGEVKVLDFGIARLREDTSNIKTTRPGGVLGTPAFMAPEQASARSRDIDPRTDLWALGASLFTLLSGQFVHESENGTQTLIAAATTPARSLASAAPEMPVAVIELVDKALSFDPAARWDSARAMSEALLGVYRALFGELSVEPLRACLDGLVLPQYRVEASVAETQAASETAAAAPAELAPVGSSLESSRRVGVSSVRRSRWLRPRSWVGVAAAALVFASALLWLRGGATPVASSPAQALPNAAQSGVFIPKLLVAPGGTSPSAAPTPAPTSQLPLDPAPQSPPAPARARAALATAPRGAHATLASTPARPSQSALNSTPVASATASLAAATPHNPLAIELQ